MRASHKRLSLRRAALGLGAILLLLCIVIFARQVFIPSLTATTHSYPAYYLASRLVIEGKWSAQVYDIPWFEARLMELTNGQVSDRFSLHPPTTSLLLVPVAWLDITTSRILWQFFNLALLVLGLVFTLQALSMRLTGRLYFLALVLHSH